MRRRRYGRSGGGAVSSGGGHSGGGCSAVSVDSAVSGWSSAGRSSEGGPVTDPARGRGAVLSAHGPSAALDKDGWPLDARSRYAMSPDGLLMTSDYHC
jgi:hypothetical protein